MNRDLLRPGRLVFLAALLPTAALCQPADIVFRGGSIITMSSEQPRVSALAVRGERLIAVGDDALAPDLIGSATRIVELGQRALLPGFIDAHGHIVFLSQIVDQAKLAPPPVGPVDSIEALRAELLRFVQQNELGPRDWLIGFGYDDSLLEERRHPTKQDLDDLFPDRPVLLRHVSGHLMAVNSRALELAEYDQRTPDPPGGLIRRLEGSREPNGVLEEGPAMSPVGALVPSPSLEQQLEQLGRGLREYASYGLTTAQDGFTSRQGLELLRQAALSERLLIDVVAFPAGKDFSPAEVGPQLGGYENGLKIGGVKLSLDGSPQGKTAYLTQPFLVPPNGQEEGYRGYPSMPQDEVDRRVASFLDGSIPLLVHANGDAAADQLIHAVDAVARRGALGEHRTVMIHSQIVREDQLDRLAELRIIPSFFVAHTFFWGDWHRDSVLGAARADRISPARSALERDLPFTFHNDAPIVPPDVMRLVWTGVNRRTRSGDILGPQQRISVWHALHAVTLGAAYQAFEESSKGSLEVGKLADLVILEEDPLEADPAALADIEVVETFSHGRSVFVRTAP